jgi:outer membrane protein assembly factor BamB
MSILYGINKTNGEKVWSYNYTLTNGYAYNSPTYFDGKVFGCFYSSSSSLLVPKVFAWNSSTGEVIWNATGGNRGCWDSSPVIHGNSVYFGSWDGSVFKLNSSTGEVIFERDFGSGVIYSNLAIKGDRIYGASSGDRFFCVNSSNGSTCLGWTDFVHGSAQWASPALGDDLVVASTRNSPSLLFALNSSTGEMVWNYTYGVNSYSSPTIANGIIYIANDDGYIYAIGNKSYYKYNSTIIGSPGENQVTFYVNDSLGSYRSKVINFYLDVEEIENSTEEDEQNDSVENNSSNSGTSTSYSYRPLSYDYTSQDISNLKEINKVLRLREKINFVFSNENHSILFSRANRTNAIIKVFSSSFERNFSIGETHFFDLNSDDLNDLFITLNELDNYKANITFGYVPLKQEILEEFVDEEVVVQENVTNSFGGYFYLLVAFFFLIILFFSIRFFKKYRSKNNSKY